MSERFLALVNPAAGSMRCGRLAAGALEKLRASGVELDIVETSSRGEATRLARSAYARGQTQFVAVGGDGTAYEIVNGLLPEAAHGRRAALGFLPLGTGNSFLRDFSDGGAEYAAAAIVAGRRRGCDVLHLKHSSGSLHFINLLSMGFAADVAAAANRRFKVFGELGYLLGVLTCLARLKRRGFPVRVDEETAFDARPCLFLSFNNSKFTGGKMMIAPLASIDDGLIEYVRWGPIGRVGLLRRLHTLFDGSHISHPLAARRPARKVEFALEGPVDVMVDGEVMTLECQSIDVIPNALDVFV